MVKSGTMSPPTEVKAQASRRRFSAKYKKRILDEVAECRAPGEIGALLRREGLYSSHLTKWRQQAKRGALAGTLAGTLAGHPCWPRRPDELDVACALIRERTEHCHELSVPLKVDLGTGQSWAEAH